VPRNAIGFVWAYFVGCALLSFLEHCHKNSGALVRLLFGYMFLFCAMVHIREFCAQKQDCLGDCHPRNVIRGGADSCGKRDARARQKQVITVGRVLIAIALYFLAWSILLPGGCPESARKTDARGFRACSLGI